MIAVIVLSIPIIYLLIALIVAVLFRRYGNRYMDDIEIGIFGFIWPLLVIIGPFIFLCYLISKTSKYIENRIVR